MCRAAPLLASAVTLQKHVDPLKMDAKNVLNYTTLGAETGTGAARLAAPDTGDPRWASDSPLSRSQCSWVQLYPERSFTSDQNNDKKPTVSRWSGVVYGSGLLLCSACRVSKAPRPTSKHKHCHCNGPPFQRLNFQNTIVARGKSRR